MPEEKNAVNEFLEGLNKPSEDLFKTEEIQMPEEEGADEEEEEEKPLPFHKDPKVQKFIEKEVGKRLADFKPTAPATAVQSEDEITEVLERIIGNDTPEKVQGVKDLRRVLGSLEEKSAQKAIQELQAQAAAETEAERQAARQLDESFEEIEETFSVDLSSNTPQARKTRSEFVDYIRKIAPKNEDGEVASFPDIPAAWEEFQERQKRTASPATRAKVLASRSMSRSNDASSAPQLVDRSWKGVEKFLSKLTN